jgi:hypothetical protein
MPNNTGIAIAAPAAVRPNIHFRRAVRQDELIMNSCSLLVRIVQFPLSVTHDPSRLRTATAVHTCVAGTSSALLKETHERALGEGVVYRRNVAIV